MAALTALQGLRDKAGLQPGEHVLVTGAGGGVGSFTVQIAKALGAGSVTATTSHDKLDHLRAVGADRVIDHGSEDVTAVVRDVDVLIDVGGQGRLSALRRTLAPDGRIVPSARATGSGWVRCRGS